ncbi:EAL domain-containing protein [Pontibacter sp. JAM-7]|uniref:two-component system response regulator n=1 Tax=Pontibacter sp. JAM-7 TaxID=3366581 RepID=UPI003AF6C06A
MYRQEKLLLVNGDGEQREILEKYLLAHTEYDVIAAENAREALCCLKQRAIHCVVSDVTIEGLDGWRLARMVRSGVFNCPHDIPFILITSLWCKRIAETTAREFDIDAVLPFSEYGLLAEKIIALRDREALNRKPRLLVIEDTAQTAALISRVLRSRFDVELLVDGDEGLREWRRQTYDLVLLDIMLPGISGPEIMQQMLLEKPDQTIVVMTAHGSMELAEEMMMQGAADFISKPFSTEQLRQVCEIAARRKDFIISNEQFADALTSMQQNERALAAQTREHRVILDNLATAVLELDCNGCVVFANETWSQLTGMSFEQSLGKDLLDFVYSDSASSVAVIRRALKNLRSGQGFSLHIEFKLRDRFNHGSWVEARLNTIRRDSSQQAITVAIDDISARKRAEQRLEHLAIHDSLTGLYNRHYFDTELVQTAALAQRSQIHHALLYINLDHFKAINDTLGHHRGDFVLKEASDRLQKMLRDSDRLCRIGGDEFAVLLSNTELDQAREIAGALCEMMASEQFVFGGQLLKVSCSIGISLIDGSGNKPQDYLQQADIALYVAKRRGRNRVHVYTEEDEASGDVRSSMLWLHAVQRAIEQDNLVLHFQPIYAAPFDQVAYYEALVRLVIGDEIVYPGQFIPALERFEDMGLLDLHVIAKSIYMLSLNPKLKKVAINLSAHAFQNERLVPFVQEKLREYAVLPERIIFELTENASLSNLSATQGMVEALSAMGCGFSIDDFGTGFSTFAYLKNLPAETVKIDGSFIKELKHSSIDLALVKSICDVAHALGKQTVAEFVEDAETLKLLGEIGVDYAQGYFLGRPQPIEELEFSSPNVSAAVS